MGVFLMKMKIICKRRCDRHDVKGPAERKAGKPKRIDCDCDCVSRPRAGVADEQSGELGAPGAS